MTEENRQSAPVPQQDQHQHETIPAPRELGGKVLQPGNASLAALQAIANAEAALDELSVNFKRWMHEEVDRLGAARAAFRANGGDSTAVDTLFEASHDIKGQAATLGYPLAADVCASLCRLLEAIGKDAEIPGQLVDHHVDAVRAMVREGATGEDNETASTLAERLRLITAEYLSRLPAPNADAEDDADSAAA